MIQRRQSFRWSLAVSLIVHGIVIGAGIWYITRHALPVVTMQSGIGGDGIKPGELFFVAVPTPVDTKVDPNDLPSVPMMDIVTTAQGDETSLPEPDSALSATAAGIDSTDSDSTPGGWIPIGAAVPTDHPTPHFGSRFSPPAPSASTKDPGGGGLGGDGLLQGGPPSPSSHNKPPRYPADARRKGIEGTVILLVEILESGKVGQLRVDDSSGSSLLDNAAIEAVRAWTFEPSIAGASLSAMSVRLPIRFVLHQ